MNAVNGSTLAIQTSQPARGRMTSANRTCVCGAVYRRTESLALTREIASFACAVCGATMESWNTAWVPTYRLVAGPTKKPEQT
jgi:hypothetical protein